MSSINALGIVIAVRHEDEKTIVTFGPNDIAYVQATGEVHVPSYLVPKVGDTIVIGFVSPS